MRRLRHSLKLFRGIMLATGLLVPFGAQAGRSDVVRVDGGLIRGIESDGVREYLGVPFATPPVGDLRWRPPQPLAGWTGIRDASAFAGACPQNGDLGVFATPSTTEDCLYLNVFTDARTAPGHRRLPVMVWIYGGGFRVGESNDYDGRELAARGHVIVVTLNYRLGVLGFFAHPALDARGTAFANYGIMDQQSALRWVRRNIAAFGGDPDKVTIFGESAGGASVIAHLVSPASLGLFQRAIEESGSYILSTYPATGSAVPLAAAERTGVAFAGAAGCRNDAAACLRRLPVVRILALQTPFLPSGGPIIDGRILPQPFKAALISGPISRVPFIDGINRNEWRWYVASSQATPGTPLTAAAYPNVVRDWFGGSRAARVIERYPVTDYPSPSLALAAAETDQFMACPDQELNRWVSAHMPTFAYEFADEGAPSYLADPGFPMGAVHTAEIQYLFPFFHGGRGVAHPLDAAQRQLSVEMIDEWVDHGDADIKRDLPWPAYRTDLDNYEVLEPPAPHMAYDRFGIEHHCQFWNAESPR